MCSSVSAKCVKKKKKRGVNQSRNTGSLVALFRAAAPFCSVFLPSCGLIWNCEAYFVVSNTQHVSAITLRGMWLTLAFLKHIQDALFEFKPFYFFSLFYILAVYVLKLKGSPVHIDR